MSEMSAKAVVAEIQKLLKKLPKDTSILVRTNDDVLKHVRDASVEDLLFNGDDIQFDVGDEPGEFQTRGKAIVIRLW